MQSAAAVAMALASLSAMAGAGKVCLENNADPTVGPIVANSLQNCTSGTIGTYYANSPELRKFVDPLPPLVSAGSNKFANGEDGTYIPLAVPDTSTYAGSNYYVLGVVEFAQRMHSDLPKQTTLRGYVQLYPRKSERAANDRLAVPTAVTDPLTGKSFPPIALKYPDGTAITWPNSGGEQVYAYDKPNYLGPIIVTKTGTPVRAQLVNLLPAGRATLDGNGKVIARNGDMFLPVDESLGGAGMALATPGAAAGDTKYPQNRASFHLHGGDNPWISDGTPHQWITPATDSTIYKTGNRMVNVPDMPFPGVGSQNVFWPNDQSARLMWYHDHTFGLTRQNAYGGEAAGYVIYDDAELALLNGGTVNGQPIGKALPGGLLDQLVLIIQDKTFVPTDIAVQDSKWDTKAWGEPGDLWFPHVYEPFQLWGTTAPDAETPQSLLNPAGRWDYAVNDTTTNYLPPRVGATRLDPDYGMVAFPNGERADGTPGKGPSATPESYMDTAVINGVAYPVLQVEPKAYRVRFLNGANDRYFNLSLWQADPTIQSPDGRTNVELTMVAPGQTMSDGNINNSPDPAGVPDPATAGPNIIQFATEAGLLPQPVVHKPALMPLDGNGEELIDPNLFYLGNAERADTVIDFSQFAGKTLILYNDSTAPVPGGDARYDYYAGGPDQLPYGGAAPTRPGYGPNTRTLMQIRVAPTLAGGGVPTAADAWDQADNGGPLATELPLAYAASTEPHIEGSLPTATAVDSNTNKLTLADGNTVDLQIKSIHGYTDPNIGRLVAQLGVDLPVLGLTPLSYIDPPTEILDQDTVQYWWIKNEDVDNHPMHFHLFNVQVLGHRDRASGELRPPTPDEMGWKETVKNWPLEDLIVAIKPKTPQLPFGLPNSVRPLDPTLVDGATANDVLFPTHVADGVNVPFAFLQADLTPGATLGQPKTVANTSYDFGWEYVWHCHILGHEENDLMRPMVFKPVLATPAAPTTVAASAGGGVTWTDPTPALAPSSKGNSANEYGFRVERAPVTQDASGNFVAGTFVAATPDQSAKLPVATVNALANATSYQDSLGAVRNAYYRVVSVGAAGETASTETLLLQTPPVASVTVAGTPAATARTLTLNWATAPNATGFKVEGRTLGGTWAPVGGGVAAANATALAITGLLPVTTYQFRVGVDTGAGDPVLYSQSADYTTAWEPGAAPAVTLATSAVNGVPQINLSWVDNATGETAYSVERCAGTAAAASCGAAAAAWTLVSNTVAANSTGYIDSTVAGATSYVYRVKALSGAAAGPVGTSAALASAPAVAAPSGLTAATANGASVVLNWIDNSTNETSFVLQRAVAGSGAFANVGAAITRTGTATTGTLGAVTATDATVVSGTSYDYRVIAVNTKGTGAAAVIANSAPSNTASITPVVPAPTGLTATTTTGAMVLSWVDTSSNENAFQITRTDANGAVTVITTPARTATLKTATGGAVTYTDATALPYVSYTYKVAAVTSAAGALPIVTGLAAGPVTAMVTLTAPSAPTAVITNATTITLTWTDLSNNENGFVVERSVDGGVNWTPVLLAGQVYTATSNAANATAVNRGLTYKDTLVAPIVQGAYVYRVKAIKYTGTGLTAVVTASTAAVPMAAPLDFTAPAVPSAFSAVPGTATKTATVSWTDAATTETGFSVQRSTSPAFPAGATTVTTAVAGALAGTGLTKSLNVTGLVKGTVYYFRVGATNVVGTKYPTTSVSITAP